VRVPRKEAAKVDGDEAAASPILVWNGLVARMRRVSAEGENASRVEVESARQTPHDWTKSGSSGEVSETQPCR
jgi:hypothetical protein